MPEPPKSNANSETAAVFIQGQIKRTNNNLRCAINTLGITALKAANPVQWFRRYPAKCSIVTGAVIAGSVAGIMLALRRKRNRGSAGDANPVQVYLKSPQNAHHWSSQLASALLAGIAGKISQGIKARLVESLAGEGAAQNRERTVIIPGTKLRDVEI